MDCKLEFLYHGSHKPSTYVGFHKHSCYELVYYLTGSGHMCIANELFKYYSNTFTITSPNLQHDEKHDEYTSVLFIGFTYDNCPVILKNGVYYDDSGLTILKLLEDMKNEFVNKGVNYEIKLDLLVKLMLIEFGRMCDNSSSKSDEFGYIKKYICENATQQIDFKALAKLSGYSYHHFRHLFKKKHRTFPIRLFNRQEN